MVISLRHFSAVAAAAAASAVCAYIGYRVVGWLGIGIVGLIIILVAVQVDMDSVAPVGDAQNAGLFAATIASQAAESRAERAGRRAEAVSRGKVLLFAKVLGVIIAVVGGLGFFLVQLPA